MIYTAYKLNRALSSPIHGWAGVVRSVWSHPLFPVSGTRVGRAVASAGEVLQRVTRSYPKPAWGLDSTVVDGRAVDVRETTVLSTPFCSLVRFERAVARNDPKVLVAAPLSGHHATLVRDTVARLLPEHDVYVTDWADARLVPLSKGRFDLDDYIDLVQRFLRAVGPGTHVVAVCQPSVPVLAAVALMEEAEDPASPRSLTLMAGPIDTRVNPTAVNLVAKKRSLAWFEATAVHRVPFGEPGYRRKVYPGFLQLSAFMSMNAGRHLKAHAKLCRALVSGEAESADAIRRFYDDYLAVIDVPAEYYLQTVQSVFQEHELARGAMLWRGARRVRTDLVRRTALMTVEGAKDDICGLGQTAAAHALCPAIPAERRQRLVAQGVGHYGVFSGRRWREEIAPRVCEFIRAAGRPSPRVASNEARSTSGRPPIAAVTSA